MLALKRRAEADKIERQRLERQIARRIKRAEVSFLLFHPPSYFLKIIVVLMFFQFFGLAW